MKDWSKIIGVSKTQGEYKTYIKSHGKYYKKIEEDNCLNFDGFDYLECDISEVDFDDYEVLS